MHVSVPYVHASDALYVYACAASFSSGQHCPYAVTPLPIPALASGSDCRFSEEGMRACIERGCSSIDKGGVGNFTRHKFKLRFCIFCGFLELFEKIAVFRKSPQDLCVVFKQRSESPQISAILRKTCAKNAETQLKKPAREISHLPARRAPRL